MNKYMNTCLSWEVDPRLCGQCGPQRSPCADGAGAALLCGGPIPSLAGAAPGGLQVAVLKQEQKPTCALPAQNCPHPLHGHVALFQYLCSLSSFTDAYLWENPLFPKNLPDCMQCVLCHQTALDTPTLVPVPRASVIDVPTL